MQKELIYKGYEKQNLTSYTTGYQLQYTRTKVMRIGIIGLDTSHSTAFTELINSGSDETFSKGFRVVAAYPYGSKTIQSSTNESPDTLKRSKQMAWKSPHQ